MSAAFLDVIAPARCVGCEGARGPLCPVCVAALRGAPAVRMPVPSPSGLPNCWSAADYTGPLRKAVLACKERGLTSLVPTLGAVLAFVIATGLSHSPAQPAPGRFTVVPVPSDAAARRRRGHDPVRAIAAAAAARLREAGLPATFAALLEQPRRRTDQSGLSSAQRTANLSHAFRVRSSPRIPLKRLWAPSSGTSAPLRPSGPVVLVDDIVTTGATLAEAARALQAAAAPVLFAATLAATRRRR
ncbi:ComF family protein [Sinosporangium siamense]|uniref:ComF family protein n=1 Tax=Sinosporangium siamense TaxID=1367973 RepID=A0A919V5M8_9ACTN|nr:phosphoribosyltransferase family protein [Sinosporangium siamense]GII91051.1 hypothetical protein Ssi02_12820 [Sinosporangium siamense]